MSADKYVIGLDFGTDSVRALFVNTADGKEEKESVAYYKRWAQGKYQDTAANIFRHHPLDYLEVLEQVITNCLNQTPKSIIDNIIAIGVDTTGSTPAQTDRQGNILALKKEFSNNPNAMFIL